MKRLLLIGMLIVAPLGVIAEEPIRLGAMGSLSGYGAEWGGDEINGTTLAVEQINQSGGVSGRRLELIVEDNNSNQEQTARGFAKLATISRVPVVFGPNWAEFAEGAAPLAQRPGVVMLTASGWTRTLTDGRPLVFSTLPSHDDVVRPLCDFVAAKHPRVTLVHSENAYFASLASSCAARLRARNVKELKEESFPPGGSDFRSYFTRLRREPPDAVVFFLLQGGENLSFLSQYRQSDMTLPLYASNGLIADTELRSRPELAEGVIAFDFALPATNEFTKAFLTRFKKSPGVYSARAYDNVFLVKQAAERCGWEPQALAKCLASAKIKGVSGDLSFTPRRDVAVTNEVSVLV
ncbi:MAG: ABC transporter substrate-binding protein, partial [Deltaproteobacteria bacterium]|nr:ABC transporter substrate-binding protein [Deltaproteobacteria bacterium]